MRSGPASLHTFRDLGAPNALPSVRRTAASQGGSLLCPIRDREAQVGVERTLAGVGANVANDPKGPSRRSEMMVLGVLVQDIMRDPSRTTERNATRLVVAP